MTHSRHGCRIVCVVVATMLSLLASLKIAAALEPSVEVEEAAWTSGVRELQYTDRYPNGGRAPHAPIYLWTRMRATRVALDQLRRDGKLPVRHRWIRYVGFDPDLSLEEPTDVIALGVGAPNLADQLAEEVAAHGWFDWRTWSGKDNVRAGKWRVEVVYKTGEPVFCNESTSGHTVPCRFFINIAP